MSTQTKRVRFAEPLSIELEYDRDNNRSSAFIILEKVNGDPSAIRAQKHILELVEQGSLRLKEDIPLQWKRVEKVLWRAKSLGFHRGIDKELENIKVARSLGTQKLALYTKGIEGHGAIIQRIRANLDWIEAELNRMAHLLSKQRPNSWRKHFARAIEVVLQ